MKMENTDYITEFERILDSGKTPNAELAELAVKQWLDNATDEELDEHFGGY